MTAAQETPTDWRGTPITEGALVIYGAPLGRSIALVEAEVVGFTKSGRVNVRILRRARGGTWSEREVVHVGADRLVVVLELPPSDVPLTPDVVAERKARRDERARIHETHDFPNDIVNGRYVPSACRRCGVARSYGYEEECPA